MRSALEFDRRAQHIRPTHLNRPTPCSEWDVRALVNHVVYEVLWCPPLLGGEKYSTEHDRYAGNVLGADPLGSWSAALEEDLRAVDDPGVLQREVHLSYGPSPAERYLNELSSDLLIHSWDLARGIDIDDSLDDDLVEHCYALSKPREEAMKRSGLFGETIKPPDDADMQTKLLAIFGRRG